MMTIAEVPEFIRRAEKLLSDQERRDVMDYLAAHPRVGDLMEGTGGVHKLRWRPRWTRQEWRSPRHLLLPQRGYAALYLLTLFGKHERANLSKAERNELSKLVQMLVLAWIKR